MDQIFHLFVIKILSEMEIFKKKKA